MKKTIIISVGVLVIILLIGVWGYLFLYGKPDSLGGVFTDLNTSNESNEIPITTTPEVTQEAESVTSSRFYQVTQRPIAGAGFSENIIQYVEQGTGHIYEVDLTTKKETLVSVTTIPKTSTAVFSKNNKYVAITSQSGSEQSTIVGHIQDDPKSGGKIDGVKLPDNATEIAFNESGEGIYYLIKNDAGTTGHLYDIVKKKSTELFSIPLRDVHILWGTPSYVYTTPTGVQTGYVYKIEGKGRLSYVTPGIEGLVAIQYEDGIITTSIQNKSGEYTAINRDGTEVSQSLPFIPEKCTSNPISDSSMFCAVPIDTSKGTFPDSWYMGIVSYNDILWNMNIETGEAMSLLIPETEIGTEFDVSLIGTNDSSLMLYLVNKNDNSLWVFDRRVQ